MHLVVVGAGFIATVLADSLLRRGCAVTMVAPARDLDGASGTTYAWLNSHRKRPDGYQRLNHIALDFWRDRFGTRFPDHVHWSGHIAALSDPAHVSALTERVAHLARLGYPATIVPSDRVPAPVHTTAQTVAAEFPGEGYCDPGAIHAEIMSTLDRDPAFAFISAEVTHLREDGVILDTGEHLSSDRVIVAAGNGSAPLLDGFGTTLPLASQESGGPAWGFLAEARVQAHGLDRLITSDALNVRPLGPDRLLLQALDLDRFAGDPGVSPPADLVTEFGRRISDLLGRSDVAVERVRTGHRVIPADGCTVAGPIAGAADDRVWTVVTHSGITLGPWLSETISAEITDGTLSSSLDSFRPTRFAETADATFRTPAPRRPGEQ